MCVLATLTKSTHCHKLYPEKCDHYHAVCVCACVHACVVCVSVCVCMHMVCACVCVCVSVCVCVCVSLLLVLNHKAAACDRSHAPIRLQPNAHHTGITYTKVESVRNGVALSATI